MRFNKKIVTSVFCALFCILYMVSNIVAKEEVVVPYVISNYKIEMKIHDNGVAQIKESIDVSNCDQQVVRKRIPTSYSYTNQSTNESVEKTYSVSNINVENHEVNTIVENKQTILNIDLTKKTDSLVLTYDVLLDDFQMENQQLFYYTLFTGFEGNILAFNAEITFPKELSFSQMQLLNEEQKLVSDYIVSYENNKMIIKTNKTMTFGTHLSLRTVLPTDYFTYGNPVDLQLVVTVLSILLISGLFIVFVSKEQSNKKKRFLSHPPKEVPMILYGYIVDGYISEKDFFPYLVQWANHGFIRVEETKHDVRILLCKELPPQVPSYERIFFDAIFGEKTIVSLYDLENKDFTLVFDELKEIVYDTLGHNPKLGIYHMNNIYYQLSSCLLAGIPIFLALYITFYTESYNIWNSLVSAFIGWGAIALSCIPWVILVKRFPVLSKNARKSMFSFIGILQGFLLFVIGYVLLIHNMNFLYIIMNILMTIFFMLILFVLDRRTKSGSTMYKQVMALDNFIRQSRVAQIDDMIYKEPNYFYNILPYVAALDLVPLWAGKFTAIMIQKPFWFLTPQTPSKAMYWVEPMVYALEDLETAILKVPSHSKNY